MLSYFSVESQPIFEAADSALESTEKSKRILYFNKSRKNKFVK